MAATFTEAIMGIKKTGQLAGQPVAKQGTIGVSGGIAEAAVDLSAGRERIEGRQRIEEKQRVEAEQLAEQKRIEETRIAELKRTEELQTQQAERAAETERQKHKTKRFLGVKK